MEVNKKRIVIDSRPSDAIAIALRTGASIYVDENVIKRAAKIDLSQKSGKVVTDTNEWEDIFSKTFHQKISASIKCNHDRPPYTFFLK